MSEGGGLELGVRGGLKGGKCDVWLELVVVGRWLMVLWWIMGMGIGGYRGESFKVGGCGGGFVSLGLGL
jgi:hypothetical protein